MWKGSVSLRPVDLPGRSAQAPERDGPGHGQPPRTPDPGRPHHPPGRPRNEPVRTAARQRIGCQGLAEVAAAGGSGVEVKIRFRRGRVDTQEGTRHFQCRENRYGRFSDGACGGLGVNGKSAWVRFRLTSAATPCACTRVGKLCLTRRPRRASLEQWIPRLLPARWLLAGSPPPLTSRMPGLRR